MTVMLYVMRCLFCLLTTFFLVGQDFPHLKVEEDKVKQSNMGNYGPPPKQHPPARQYFRSNSAAHIEVPCVCRPLLIRDKVL